MLSLLTMAFMPVYAQWCMQICTLYISYTFLISGTLSYYTNVIVISIANWNIALFSSWYSGQRENNIYFDLHKLQNTHVW